MGNPVRARLASAAEDRPWFSMRLSERRPHPAGYPSPRDAIGIQGMNIGRFCIFIFLSLAVTASVGCGARAPQTSDPVILEQRGAEAYSKKDYRAAASLFHESAARGYPPAESDLGWSYLNGLGVLENLDLSIAWYTAAATQNVCEAQYRLGAIYSSTDINYATALYWYLQAAGNYPPPCGGA